MAKESGVGVDALYVGGYDLSGDTGAVQVIAQRRAPLEVTGLNKSAVERIVGMQDGEISFNSWFNPATSQEHPVLSTLPTADRSVMYFHNATAGSPAAALIAKQIDYPVAVSQDGAVAISVQALANGSSVDWGEMLTNGKQTFASASSGTIYDYTATPGSTAFGAVGYLQVFSVASGTATVAIHDSADGTTFAAITGMTFTGATAITDQRLATATGATIRRYVRVVTTGTFTNCVCAVVFRKFDVAQS